MATRRPRHPGTIPRVRGAHRDDSVAAVRASIAGYDAAADVANVFRALADPTRVRILHALSIAELCNGDLASVLGMSESAVSHQMRELRLMKIVSAEKRGRMVYFRLTDAHVRRIFADTLRHVREGRAPRPHGGKEA